MPFTLASVPDEGIPPLENGDELTRAEFHRRYEAMSEDVWAQLIEGVVYMGGRVKFRAHGAPHARLNWALGHYYVNTAGVQAAVRQTIFLDDLNEPQPDLILFIDPELGGQIAVEDGFLTSAPELVAEICSTKVSIELGLKLKAYERNGVREYLVWRTLDRVFDWFVRRDGRFTRLEQINGVFRSEMFPGLWLHVDALLKDDGQAVLQTLNQGLQSPEHQAFVEKLRTHS